MPLRQIYPEADSRVTSRPRVDIIAVHGLNPRGTDVKAHAWDTWRKPSGPSGRLWLRDDLANHTPESRIFIYEYNSSFIFGGEKARFIDKADELLEDLRLERRADERRPIIFLAHSLGGILVEQALVNSFNSAKHKSIHESTSGLVFFGTPHNGGNRSLVALGSAAARVTAALHLQPSSDIGEALKCGSLYTDILKDFWRERLLDYDLISFWEGIGNVSLPRNRSYNAIFDKSTAARIRLMGEQIVPKESAVFGVPSNKENIVKLNASHSDLCRFDLSEADQDNFKLVRGNIEDIYAKALEKDSRRQEIERRQKVVLNWLFGGPTSTRHLALQDVRKGTGQDLLRNAEFQQWYSDKSFNGGFWCLGIPGTGKTVLSSFAIDHLEKERSTSTESAVGIAYIYFERQELQQQNVVSILGCLLKQLATQNFQVFQHFDSIYGEGTHQRQPLTVRALESAMVLAIEHFDTLFLVLDALDECDEVTIRGPLLLMISRLKEAGARILVTSRPHPADLHYSFHHMTKFEVQAGESDILAYIDDHLQNSPRAKHLWGGNMKSIVANSLIASANGLFLPIPFQLEHLSQQISLGGVKRELKRLEEHISRDRILDRVYDRALENLQRQLEPRKSTAMAILNWLMFAKTTMTSTGLSIGLVVQPDENQIDPIELVEEEILTDVCAGFVSIDHRNRGVRFIHSTAQEYLLRKMPEGWNATACAVTCAQYLSYADFSSGPCPDQVTFLTRRAQNPFFEYAARYLSTHVQDCAEESQELVQAILRLLRLPRNMMAYLQVALGPAAENSPFGHDWYPSGSTPLHAAANIGYAPAIRAYVGENGNALIHALNSLGQTPLHMAAKGGFVNGCQVLLEHGADPLRTDRYGYTPLAWAVWMGHQDVIPVFAAREDIDAVVASRTRSGETLLHVTARRGHVSIALALLRLHTDVNAVNSNRQTPLDIAKSEGNVSLESVFTSAMNLLPAEETPISLAPESPVLPFVDALEEMVAGFAAQTSFDETYSQQANTDLPNGEVNSTSGSDPGQSADNNTQAQGSDQVVRFLRAEQFNRVVEFSDEECLLREPTDDLRRICAEHREGEVAPLGRVWSCRLDTDVNLRSLVFIDRGHYIPVWLFAYHFTPGPQLSGHVVQSYNCSMGDPLDATMFMSRITDPAQPFISTNLNAIINPRVTTTLLVPNYVSNTHHEFPDQISLTRHPEGVITLGSQRPFNIDWEGPTAFLIKSVSSRVYNGELFFLGVLLYESGSPVHDQQAFPTEVR